MSFDIHVLHAGFVENQVQRREEKRERGNDFARYSLWEMGLACSYEMARNYKKGPWAPFIIWRQKSETFASGARFIFLAK